MKIDKQFHHIAYNDEVHVYWNLLTKERYKSVTTLIGNYTPQFDTEGKSLACAKRDVREGLTTLSVLDRQEELKAQWKEKNRISTEVRGTPIHNAIEMLLTHDVTAKEVCETTCLNKEFHKYVYYIEKKKFKDRGAKLHPEVLVYSDKYKLAGQSDLMLEYNDYLEIYDWKTNANKDLSYTCDYHTKFLSPLMFTPAGKLSHYAMQLAIYQIFAEQIFDKPVKLKSITHFKNDTDIIDYDLKDYKEYAQVILDDYLVKRLKREAVEQEIKNSK